MEYVLISVPSKSYAEKELSDRTQFRNLSRNTLFHVPAGLKVGTLGELVALSDELVKVDNYIFSVASKLAHSIKELLNHDEARVAETITVEGRTLTSYVEHFEWNSARFNERLAPKDLVAQMNKQIGSVETNLKTRLQAYNKIKSNLQSIDRKSNGSLLIRSIGELIKPEHVVTGSEFLVTLLVVVPKYMYNEWDTSYEQLTEYVVPRSSTRVAEDSEYGLFTVTLFRKIADDFKHAAREKKFIVREYEYNASEVEEDEEEKAKLTADLRKKFGVLVDWCSQSFTETFTAWIHLKALRVFVESVLRFGLPPEFTSVAMRTEQGSKKKLRQALGALYNHLDGSEKASKEDIEIPGLIAQQEYFPYVSFDIELKPFLETR